MNPYSMTSNNVWEIDDVIGLKSWINSEQFCFEGVGIDLGLRKVQGQNFLHLRVRKNDLRSAKATVQIKQIQHIDLNSQQNPIQSAFGGGIQSRGFSSFNPSISTVLGQSEINDWKECFIFKIAGYKNESSKVLTKDNSFTYMKMTLQWEITSLSFIYDKFEKITPTNFKRYLKADLFNDIVLVVDDKELPAHKIILSVHSPYFHAMLTTDMKEVKENRITIKNFSLDAITEMLTFFYTGKTKASDDFDVALKMIELAQMYQIDNMIKICENTITENININNVLSIINVADDLNIIQLRNNAINFICNNISVLVDLPEFKDLCKSKPMLMFELMRAMGKKVCNIRLLLKYAI